MSNKHMKRLIENILQFLLPKDELTLEFERATPESLRSKALLVNCNLPKNITALFDYKNPVIKNAIWQLKYRGNENVAKIFAECLYEEIMDETSEKGLLENFQNPLILPSPISKQRLKERGFNQCELLTNHLEKLFNRNDFQIENNLLIKIKNTGSQTYKNRAERLENLKNCFALAGVEKVKNRNVIVIDDVTTTGATFEEITDTLKHSGAKRTICIALAH